METVICIIAVALYLYFDGKVPATGVSSALCIREDGE